MATKTAAIKTNRKIMFQGNFIDLFTAVRYLSCFGNSYFLKVFRYSITSKICWRESAPFHSGM